MWIEPVHVACDSRVEHTLLGKLTVILYYFHFSFLMFLYV